MKLVLLLTLALVFVQIADAQSQAITKGEYDTVFGSAVRATNAAFPFVFTVSTEKYEDRKVLSLETNVSERQAQGVERTIKTLTTGKQTVRAYSVMVGFGKNTYCSTNGKSWSGPQQYVCPGPDGASIVMLQGPRTPETAEYTVTDKHLKGAAVKVYREYSVFAPSEPKGKKSFSEKISTIDSRGFFVEVVGTEGTLGPRTVTLTRKQTWTLNAKFTPVQAPSVVTGKQHKASRKWFSHR